MSDVAIRVCELSKRYRLGEREPYKTLREALSRAASAPFRHARSAIQRANGHPAEDTTKFIWALRDVSFEIKKGEAVGIIGRNGSGKSTLLKILSHITEPTEGYAEIHGRVGSLLEVGTGFHPELTGRENIYLNGSILGMRQAEIDRKFDEIVAFAEVEKFLDTPVKRYSSGMYVRLAFAVAAHLEPEILLVDEVLAVGDVAFQKKCLERMGDVTREGRTVLFVSHNLAAVERLCSCAILLSDGRTGSSGDVHSVVGFYLSSANPQKKGGDGVLARSPSSSLELLSVQLSDGEGAPSSMAQCGRDLRVNILLRIAVQLERVTISVGINHLDDTRVATLHSDIAGYALSLSPGIRSVVCRVARFPLVPGSYVLDVKVLSGREVVLWAPRVAQLNVEGGDFYSSGRSPDPSWAGFCYLNQQWAVHEGG